MNWELFEAHAREQYALFVRLAHLGLDTPVMEALGRANVFLGEGEKQGLLHFDIIQYLQEKGYANNPFRVQEWSSPNRETVVTLTLNMVTTVLSIVLLIRQGSWNKRINMEWREGYEFTVSAQRVEREEFIVLVKSWL